MGCTVKTFIKLLLSVQTQAPRQTNSAVSCTNALAVQILEDFVTCVLNTPCTLISAPEIRAIKNPIIECTFLSGTEAPVPGCPFFSKCIL